MDVCTIPFNNWLGMSSVATDTGTVVSLSPQPHHLNHLGTVHAAVIFAAAEAASGQAPLDHFADLAESAMLVLRSSTTKYRAPAVAGGPLTAQAHIGAEAVDAFRRQLASRGRALIEVTAGVVQDGQDVFRGTYTFFGAMHT